METEARKPGHLRNPTHCPSPGNRKARNMDPLSQMELNLPSDGLEMDSPTTMANGDYFLKSPIMEAQDHYGPWQYNTPTSPGSGYFHVQDRTLTGASKDSGDILGPRFLNGSNYGGYHDWNTSAIRISNTGPNSPAHPLLGGFTDSPQAMNASFISSGQYQQSYPSPETENSSRQVSAGASDYAGSSPAQSFHETPTVEGAECKGQRFRCEWPSCKDRRSFERHCAFKRHHDKHTKPYLCYHKECKRSKKGNGFSRPDNLRTHLYGKKHRGHTCCSPAARADKEGRIEQLEKELAQLKKNNQ